MTLLHCYEEILENGKDFRKNSIQNSRIKSFSLFSYRVYYFSSLFGYFHLSNCAYTKIGHIGNKVMRSEACLGVFFLGGGGWRVGN